VWRAGFLGRTTREFINISVFLYFSISVFLDPIRNRLPGCFKVLLTPLLTMTEEQNKDTWFIPASEESKQIINTIKQVVDGRKLDKNPDKDVLNLSIGMSIGY